MRQPILGLKRLSHCLIVSSGSRQRSGFFSRPTGDCLIVSLSHRGPGRDPDFFPAQLGIVSLSHCLIGVPAEIRIFFPPNWGLSHCLIVSSGSRNRSGFFSRPTGDCLIVSLSHRGPGRDPDFVPAQLGIVSLSHCLIVSAGVPPQHSASHRIQSIASRASHPEHRIQSIGGDTPCTAQGTCRAACRARGSKGVRAQGGSGR